MSNALIQHSRILVKRSTDTGVVPTIPSSDDHTDETWLDTDIYIGEFFVNAADGIIWHRFSRGIQMIYPCYGTPGPGQDVYVYDKFKDFPVAGESEKIYIAADTELMYRWDGSGYSQLATVGSVLWENVIGAPASTSLDIDAAVTAMHDVDDPNASHYTKVESDGIAGVPGAKVDKVAGKDLSTNDFTNKYKTILDNWEHCVEEYTDETSFPASGVVDKLYIAKISNKLYRWNEDSLEYIQMTAPNLITANGSVKTVPAGDTVIIPQYFQNLVYGTITVAGILENAGEVASMNGEIIITDDGDITGDGDILIVNF